MYVRELRTNLDILLLKLSNLLRQSGHIELILKSTKRNHWKLETLSWPGLGTWQEKVDKGYHFAKFGTKERSESHVWPDTRLERHDYATSASRLCSVQSDVQRGVVSLPPVDLPSSSTQLGVTWTMVDCLAKTTWDWLYCHFSNSWVTKQKWH